MKSTEQSLILESRAFRPLLKTVPGTTQSFSDNQLLTVISECLEAKGDHFHSKNVLPVDTCTPTCGTKPTLS